MSPRVDVSGPPLVRIEGVTRRFGPVVAVDRVSLDIPENAFYALLGPSGCGKTTLLRMIAGFEQPDEGRILLDGEDMTRVPPNRRPVNMVFQSYAVFPHMTVWKNVAYGLEVTGVPQGEIRRRVEEALALVRLEGMEARRPHQLSGGQKQRVALARALVKRPRLLLLDEPLSALDRKLREDMQMELVRLRHEVGITFLLVTHDQDEALSMADRIAVMNAGRVLQVADPRTLYEQPRTRFVAEFIGTANLFEGRVVARCDGTVRVRMEDLGEVRLPAESVGNGTHLRLALRPEKWRVDPERPPTADLAVAARLVEMAYHGDTSRLHLEAGGRRLVAVVHNARRGGDPRLVPGARVWLGLAAADLVVLED